MLADAFRPLQDFNVTDIYESYGPFIDFFLFAALFVGLAQVTIGRRFRHRGIAVVLGIILATALTALEPVIGLNIKSLGPLAAAIVVLAVGLCVYHLFRQLTTQRLTALCAAYLVVYLGILLYSPNYIEWITEAWPLLGGAMMIVALASIFVMAAALISRHRMSALLPRRSLPSRTVASGVRTQRDVLIPTRRFIRQARKDSQTIIADLKIVHRILQRTPDIRPMRQELVRRLRAIAPTRHDLDQQLQRMREVVRQLQAMDERLFKDVKHLPPETRSARKAAIKAELEKLSVEQKLSRFTEAVAQRRAEFNQAIEEAITCIRAGDAHQAMAILEQCMAVERDALDELRRMQTYEELLLRLTEQELTVSES